MKNKDAVSLIIIGLCFGVLWAIGFSANAQYFGRGITPGSLMPVGAVGLGLIGISVIVWNFVSYRKQSLVDAVQSATASMAQTKNEERALRLVQLRDAGVITSEQFDERISELKL